jgi:hypothetical protein
MAIERTHVSKQRLTAVLPAQGAPGWTAYVAPGGACPTPPGIDPEDAARFAEVAERSGTGAVLFENSGGATLVVPPFGIEREATFDTIETEPLIELLERRRSYAVFLLRLGGFAVGFFRCDALIDSKVDQRFVKGRHRKGGQSSTRFARIREKQVHELFEKACATSREKLTPYEAEIAHVFFGGDRRTVQAFRKECTYFERFGDRVMSRLLAAHGDPRLAMLEAMPREVWELEVHVAHRPPPGG